MCNTALTSHRSRASGYRADNLQSRGQDSRDHSALLPCSLFSPRFIPFLIQVCLVPALPFFTKVFVLSPFYFFFEKMADGAFNICRDETGLMLPFSSPYELPAFLDSNHAQTPGNHTNSTGLMTEAKFNALKQQLDGVLEKISTIDEITRQVNSAEVRKETLEKHIPHAMGQFFHISKTIQGIVAFIRCVEMATENFYGISDENSEKLDGMARISTLLGIASTAGEKLESARSIHYHMVSEKRHYFSLLSEIAQNAPEAGKVQEDDASARFTEAEFEEMGRKIEELRKRNPDMEDLSAVFDKFNSAPLQEDSPDCVESVIDIDIEIEVD